MRAPAPAAQLARVALQTGRKRSPLELGGRDEAQGGEQAGR